ncbi:putative inner membrane protein [Novipirellula galeiformis]|uniref:Putative inner membrane protein n=1 Tax=Novipirellula galeiformis TaxID=2528004 RepID=A0A5C6CPC6_9BACT|nr:YeeE/YedE thiosulfate transporter family protein [Novipirellula galeiformis]TWU26248.1 putative inner membrane protein [Novipirellula galeiformis]
MATTTPEIEPETPPVETQKLPAAASGQTLALGLMFGIIFGFLLQKGGVAKYHVLIGQLLLEDFTVLKVMLSAVVVGSIGIHFLHRMGWVQLHVKPTRYASNALGGLLFGVGFALSAYCPGTGAAALGQGNYDALFMMLGMVVGSYLFAEASGWISRHLDRIGDRGKLTLHDWIHANRTLVVLAQAVVLGIVLAIVEMFAVR